MKKLEIIFAWGIFLAASAYAVHSVDSEPETTVTVTVLKKELDNARQMCHNGASDVIVFDFKKQAKYLPCSDVVIGEK